MPFLQEEFQLIEAILDLTQSYLLHNLCIQLFCLNLLFKSSAYNYNRAKKQKMKSKPLHLQAHFLQISISAILVELEFQDFYLF
jgi:hypothetical protein